MALHWMLLVNTARLRAARSITAMARMGQHARAKTATLAQSLGIKRRAAELARQPLAKALLTARGLVRLMLQTHVYARMAMLVPSPGLEALPVALARQFLARSQTAMKRMDHLVLATLAT